MIRLNKENINIPEFFNKKFNGALGVYDMARLHALIKYFRGGVYVDVGCMDSIMPILLAENKDNEVYALDFANEIINFLRPRFPKVHYKTIEDATVLPFENNSVDYIVGGELIEHLEHPKDFILESLRVLKPGGVLAISTPWEEGVSQESVGGKQHLWSFNYDDIKELFGECEMDFIKESYSNSVLVWKRK